MKTTIKIIILLFTITGTAGIWAGEEFYVEDSVACYDKAIQAKEKVGGEQWSAMQLSKMKNLMQQCVEDLDDIKNLKKKYKTPQGNMTPVELKEKCSAYLAELNEVSVEGCSYKTIDFVETKSGSNWKKSSWNVGGDETFQYNISNCSRMPEKSDFGLFKQYTKNANAECKGGVIEPANQKYNERRTYPPERIGGFKCWKKMDMKWDASSNVCKDVDVFEE